MGTHWISIKQIRAPYLFDREHGIALHAMQENRASSLAEGEVSWFFSSCGNNLGYILEVWRDGYSKLVYFQRCQDSCLVMIDISV